MNANQRMEKSKLLKAYRAIHTAMLDIEKAEQYDIKNHPPYGTYSLYYRDLKSKVYKALRHLAEV